MCCMLSFESFYKQSLLLEYALQRYRVSFTKQGDHEVYHLDDPGESTPDSTVMGVISDHGDTLLPELISSNTEWTGRRRKAALYAINVRPMDREEMMHLFRYKLINDPLNNEVCNTLSDWAVQELSDLLIARRNEIQQSVNRPVFFVRPQSQSVFNRNVEEKLHEHGVEHVHTIVAVKNRMDGLLAAVDEMGNLMGQPFVNYLHSANFNNISQNAFSRDALATDYVASGYSNKDKLQVMKDLELLHPSKWNMFQHMGHDVNGVYLLYDDNFSKGFTETHLKHVFANVPESNVEYYVGLQVIGRKTTDDLDSWEQQHLAAQQQHQQRQQIYNTFLQQQTEKSKRIKTDIDDLSKAYHAALVKGDREAARQIGKAINRNKSDLEAIVSR